MRPLSITLDGFRSYAQRSEFDFRHRQLVGIVGPIGSGKSTILDAVAFALYGMTPTERSSTKSLIHQRSDAARVELVFEVDGQVWRAVRALRRAGQSEHALYRYSSDAGLLAGEDPLERVLKKGEVDQRIEQLLGLDFAAFNRSVLLAQGRFAELLQATATQRDEVLKGVFGFERIGSMERLAKLRRDTAARDLEELGRERDTLHETRQRLEQAEVEAGRARSRLEELTAIEPELEKQTALVDEAVLHRDSAEARLATLAEMADQMPDPADTATVLSAAADSFDEESALTPTAHAARAEAQNAAAKVAEMLSELGGEDALSRAGALVASLASHREGLATVEKRLAAAKADHLARIADLERLGSAQVEAAVQDEETVARLAAADEAARAAESAHHDALHADMAATLRGRLQQGDECPVCAQKVSVLPEAVPVDVTAAEQALERARKLLREAAAANRASNQRLAVGAKEVESAESLVATATSSIEGLEKEAAAIRVSIARAEAEAEALPGDGDPEHRLRSIHMALAGARSAADITSRRADELQEKLESSRRKSREAGQALERLSARLHQIAGRLGEEVAIGSQPDEVKAAVSEMRDRWKRARQTAADEKVDADGRLESSRQEIARLLGSAGLDAETDFNQAKAEVQAKLARSIAEAEIHGERVAASATLAARIDEAEARFDLHKTLATELTPSRFLNFLLREERAVLSDLGGHRFEELSGGRFRFSRGWRVRHRRSDLRRAGPKSRLAFRRGDVSRLTGSRPGAGGDGHPRRRSPRRVLSGRGFRLPRP